MNSVLIVDDEKNNIIALTQILSGEYTVYAAKNGQDAIEAAKEFKPGVILLDILMPEMDGYEALSLLKNTEETREIPIIIITGLVNAEDEEKGLGLGAADYITKPFSPVIVKLRVKNQIQLLNQIKIIEDELKQQTLMASISRSFLSDTNIDTLITDTLRMVGEFLGLTQVLLRNLEEDGRTFTCRYEWMSSDANLDTRIGTKIVLNEDMISFAGKFMDNGGLCLHSNDPVFRQAMKPYRVNFNNFITAPVFIKDKLCAVLDFSRKDESRQWSVSDINLAIHVAGILSGVYERSVMTELETEKKLAQQSSRAKSEFLARMSHEMHTPMNAIIGMTNIAKVSGDTEKRNDCLERIDNASRQLLSLIDDMLDISSLESSTLRFKYSDFSFNTMLFEVLNTVKLYTDEKFQTLSHSVDPLIPLTLNGDRNRLSQVIRNLLMNASKFTGEHGKIELNAFFVKEEKADTEDKDKAVIKIEVIDNGIGISREKQNVIFHLFEQADGGVSRKYGGAGLGLTISKQIVELMGGSMSLESEQGKGSKFSFTFKALIVREKEAIQEAAAEEEKEKVNFKDKTALLVEDLATNRFVFTNLLKETQLNIEIAENGLQAVQMFSANPQKYDIIFMDISMPVMDGWEATRRIRALDVPEAKKITIMAVTAHARPEDIEKCVEAGMNDHTGKPIVFDELVTKLKKIFA
jgi:signal transduction histidine kinase/PleD family two-component response regulator